jgi:hypothetical protein
VAGSGGDDEVFLLEFLEEFLEAFAGEVVAEVFDEFAFGDAVGVLSGESVEGAEDEAVGAGVAGLEGVGVGVSGVGVA